MVLSLKQLIIFRWSIDEKYPIHFTNDRPVFSICSILLSGSVPHSLMHIHERIFLWFESFYNEHSMTLVFYQKQWNVAISASLFFIEAEHYSDQKIVLLYAQISCRFFSIISQTLPILTKFHIWYTLPVFTIQFITFRSSYQGSSYHL